ncbi:hypothetical protein B0T10DRAFT_607566 [Thelonectria olida]|uniref:Uncharacterized protein n=1 Tax=Thelonectria olida TaxID=1576542 RepID=A0A9P9ARF9_9HYPO|nr:hypothetical protein B0T10DRAFT_607566 [Thelonectria olida]
MPNYDSRRHHRGRRGRDPYYSDDDDYYYSSEDERQPRGRSRSKSVGRAILDRVGAIGALGTLGDRFASRSRSRRGRSRTSRGRSRSHDRRHKNEINKKDRAVHAAIDAAVVEAVRLRGKPGKWTGSKGARVATAAASAAVINTMLEGQRPGRKHGKGTTVEAVIGGLVANRLVNGKRDELNYR